MRMWFRVRLRQIESIHVVIQNVVTALHTCFTRIHDILVNDTLVVNILVTDISVTGRFVNKTFW